jgi:beta-glucosidase
VIGPSADDPVALLGNYHGISSKQVTPLEGIQKQFTSAQVQYAPGATYTASTPSLVPTTALTPPDGNGHGVQVEYFDNPELQGQPKLRRTEPRVYFDLGMEDPAIITAVGREKYSVRWTSTLTPMATGEYRLNIRRGFGPAAAQVRVFLDGKELDFGIPPAGQPTPAQLAPGARRVPQVTLQLEGGHKYALRIEYPTGHRWGCQLAWIPRQPFCLPRPKRSKDSDVTIVCVGLSSELEGEEMRGLHPWFSWR